MKQLINIMTYAGYVLVGFFIILLLVFKIDDDQYSDKIYRNFYLANIDISGLTQDEFYPLIDTLQQELEEKVIYLAYNKEKTEVHPADLGLHIDREEMWEEAYRHSHPEGFFNQFRLWITSYKKERHFELETLVDTNVINHSLDTWEATIEPVPPYNGDIKLVGMHVDVDLPKDGSTLDREALGTQSLEAMINKPSGSSIKVPLKTIPATRTVQEYADAEYMVMTFIASPLEVTSNQYPDKRVVLSATDLAQLTHIVIPSDPNLAIHITLDEEQLETLLEPLTPQDASFNTTDPTNVTVTPSRDGFILDIQKTAERIIEAGGRPEKRKALFVAEQYILPSFTTEDAEALHIDHLVSQFTTYHGCCQDRVENIHLVADLVNDTYLAPGEVFNMNEFLGERTEDRGFKTAGTIIKGKLEESVGGGISQFMTTFHNAVYWGGYQVLQHKTHTIYFSRYPVGIEATINWPWVDYIFKNDTDTGLYITTSYTDTSITVSFYASNKGRQAIGEQSGGTTHMNVTNASPDSRIVISNVSEKYNFREPLIEYIADDTLKRGQEVVESYGDPRWSVNVTRVIKEGDTVIRTDFWPVHYQQDNTIIRKHPCDFYNEDFDYSRCVSE